MGIATRLRIALRGRDELRDDDDLDLTPAAQLQAIGSAPPLCPECDSQLHMDAGRWTCGCGWREP